MRPDRNDSKLLLSFRFAVWACLCVWPGLAVRAAGDAPRASTPIELKWQSVRGIDQPFSDDSTRVRVVYRLGGKQTEVMLPVAADTTLWNKSDKPNGATTSLVLRDNRFAQALIKVDCKNLVHAH